MYCAHHNVQHPHLPRTLRSLDPKLGVGHIRQMSCSGGCQEPGPERQPKEPREKRKARGAWKELSLNYQSSWHTWAEPP